MTTENIATAAATVATTLVNGQFMMGRITKPYLKDNKLLGAVLAFDGCGETALLHIRQMSGEKPAERLADLDVGDSLLVRIIIQQEGAKRPQVWATEQGVEHSYVLDKFEANKEEFCNAEGRVHGLTDFGIFVELMDGPAKGHRGLVRSSSMSNSGRVKLGSFIIFKPGDSVDCDVAEMRIDESSKLLLRLENIRPRMTAAA